MKRKFWFIFLLCFFCVSVFCEEGDGGAASQGPTEAMTDSQLEGYVTGGTEEESETASQILNDRHKSRIADLQRRMSELITELDSVNTNHNTESNAAEINAELNELNAELTMLQNQVAEEKKENKDTSANQLAEKDSATPGDPVKASVGSYLQQETDISNGMFEVKRKYESNNKIISSLGYAWTFNLDQRIILGTEPDVDEVYNKMWIKCIRLSGMESAFKKKIVAKYKVSSLEKGLDELNSKMSYCQEVENRAQQLADENHGEIDLSSLFTAIDSKKAAVQKEINDYKNDLLYLNELKKESKAAAQEFSEYEENIIQKNNQRKLCNLKVKFEGTDAHFEETGFDTITIIDEEGNPHILYETEEGSEIWKNEDDLNYVECIKTGSNYKVTQNGGEIKLFNEDGFLISITDRNENQLNILRDQDGKIQKVSTSNGEEYCFDYAERFINKITNLRAPEENVIYSYYDGKLYSVTDTDGDLVQMEYNSSGKLSALKKCDGSKVLFSYGEQTAEGKLLATSTTNEEGFSEYFEYDINGKRTDYTDHDGNKTVYIYDDKHRTVRELHSDGTEINNEYDEDGNLIKTNENGNIIQYEYDDRGNKISASYNDGSYEYWTYDSFDLVTSYTDRDSIREDYIRDSKGNLIEHKKAGKTIYSCEIDSKGQATKKTVYGQRTYITDYEYDSYGNLISETCGGIKKEYAYDKRNRIVCMKTAGKIIKEYEYDRHKVIERNYNGLETVYLSNGRKDLIKVTQTDTATGVVHTMRVEYDKRHLPVKVFAGDDKTEKLIKSYLYTKAGKLQSEISHGEKNRIKNYEYKNGKVSKISQYSFEGADIDAYDTSVLQNPITTQIFNYTRKNNNGFIIAITDGKGITSSFEYDAYGNLVCTINGNDERFQKNYSRAGRLKAEQSGYGGWYEYEYDSLGLLVKTKEQGGAAESVIYYPDETINSTTDFYGNVSKYYYDRLGRVICISGAQSKIEYEYDVLNRVVKQTVSDAANGTGCIYYKTIEYSADGRKLVITEGGKYKTTLEYDAFGNLIKQTDGNGNTRTYEYDSQNNLTAAYDGYGNKTSYEYNAYGKIQKKINPDGSVTNYEYNDFDSVQKITDENGMIYSAVYDKGGRLIKQRSRADVEKAYEYDNAGRIKTLKSGGEIVESYAYQNLGRNVTVKDGNGNNYFYAYDTFGRLVNEKNRKAVNQNYYYDEGGQLKSQNNYDDSVTANSFNKARSVRTVSYSDGSKNQFVYDAAGNLLNIKNDYENSVYQYNQGNRMIYQKNEETGEEVFYEYDAAGNRIRLRSSNHEITYQYGKNNEVKEIFDNKQRVHVILEYNVNGSEVLRKFGNGIKEQTLYDNSGRITVKMQKTERGELLWGEAYVYGDDGKRIATADNAGRVTLYEYNNQGQLKNVFYPYTAEHAEKIKKEAMENGLSSEGNSAENQFLSASLKNKIVPLINSMQYGLAFNLTNLQLFIKESYTYDRNGNRITRSTPYGTIEYTYDKENCLISSGSGGQTYIRYTYDEMGNLLTQDSGFKRIKYAYNSQNRLIYCEVINDAEKTCLQSNYAYDALGRRVLVRDVGEAALRTIYDGLSFDVIKQSPSFDNALFTDYTDAQNAGIQWGKTGKPTGDRYRYIDETEIQDNSRYINLDNGSYKNVSCRYQGERSQLSINGNLAVQTTFDNGPEYFTTDLLGSVRSSTDISGGQKISYSYDAFGALTQGSFTTDSDFGYLGKQHDPTASLYNYGYRDYSPQTSRFTTQDPIRDGENWFAYCNGDPVNFVDLWGLFFYGQNGQSSITAVKKTTVVILRDNDGTGNEFNSTRLIYKDDGINTKLVYVDVVGANCKPEYDGKEGSTTPDGTYYLSNSILVQQSDGTFNSASYDNVLSLMTNDQNLTQEQRDMINTGDRLFHANQFSASTKPYNSNLEPGSAGCIIGKDGQVQQDLMMEILMDGVQNPESITVLIKSMYNVGCGK